MTRKVELSALPFLAYPEPAKLTVPGSNHFLAQLKTVGKKEGAPTTKTRSI